MLLLTYVEGRLTGLMLPAWILSGRDPDSWGSSDLVERDHPYANSTWFNHHEGALVERGSHRVDGVKNDARPLLCSSSRST
jgi:hypothetical protein